MHAARFLSAMGGRVKPAAWRNFERPADWSRRAWQSTDHLAQRCAERRITAAAVATALPRADLYVPLSDGRLKLCLSRRALRRLEQRATPDRLLRQARRLVLVVDGDVVLTAWLDDARCPQPGGGPETADALSSMDDSR